MTTRLPMPPTKVLPRRYLAAIIDGIPGFVIYWALIRALGDHVGRESGTQLVMQTEVVNDVVRAQLGGDVYTLEMGTFSVIAVITLAYWIGVYVVWQGATGATIGKSIVGIRTVGADGQPCGIGRAAARWALLVVDLFPFLLPLVGFFTSLTSDGNRRVGDMAAGTYVVRADAVGQPVRTPRTTMPMAHPGAAAIGTPLPAPPTPPAAGQDPLAPHWDEAANAYILWNPDRQEWQQWDAATNQWRSTDP